MQYIFRQAREEELTQVYEIIKKRVQWMDENNIKQWNTTDYLNVYPLEYFRGHFNKGQLYVMTNDADILGVMVLLPQDPRWPEYKDTDSYFVHNFATKIDIPGIGALMLEQAELLSISHGKQFLRLDCPSHNVFLNNYYESKAYKQLGTCIDGLYKGNRREKKLI